MSLNDGFETCRLGDGRITGHYLSLCIHEKFGEIPFDGISAQAGLLLPEEFVEGMCVFSVDVYFGKNRIGQAQIHLTYFLDFFVASWFLIGKLAAWKGKNLQTFFLVFIIKLLQIVKLGCKPAFAGSVDNEKRFPLVI